MELDKIKIILEKYFEATATEAEEQELRNYFGSGGIPGTRNVHSDVRLLQPGQ